MPLHQLRERSGTARRESSAPDRLAPVVEIGLLGGVSIGVGGRQLALASLKGRALLGYLAYTQAFGASRETLCGLLWSESTDARARSSLRQSLRNIQQELGGAGVLRASRTEIGLHLDRVRVDVGAIVEAVERGQIPPVLLNEERLAESLFGGLDDLDPAFLAWLRIQRTALSERLSRALENGLAVAVTRRDRRDCAEALANLDPSHEGAARALMRLYAEAGDTASALRHYKRLWNLLDAEYGMEPSQETSDLVAEIKRGTLSSAGPQWLAPQVAARGTARSGGRLRLAIGRFKADGLPESQRYIVDGFRQEMIARLLRFREWIIVDGESPGAAETERGNPSYQLFAAVRPEGKALYLLLTLYDQYHGEYVWSERHLLSLERWFEAQQQILRGIAVGVNVHLSAQRLTRIAGQPEVSLEIYDRWLYGQALSLRWNPEDELKAETILKGVIREAPQFAPAYCSLVQILNARQVVFPGVRRNRAREAEALGLARQAVQMDPHDSRTHLCLAWACANNGHFHAAEASFQQARELNENDPWTLVSTALGLAYSGSYELVAVPALPAGLRLAPLHWGYFAGIHFMLGAYEECVRAAERAHGQPRYLLGWKVAALGQLGRVAEARGQAAEFFATIRADWHGRGPATEEAVIAWFLNAFPIRDDHAWARLREGLRLAGLPVAPDLAREEPE